MRKLLSLTLLALAGTSAFAGGYRVSLQGQKQLAMGHTGVAVVNSAEVLFFNPAGMAFLEDKFNASVGANALFAKTKFQNETYNWQNSTDNLGTPFNVYASYKINKWLSAGIAVYTPYGSKVEWDQDWQGSHLVNNIDLKAIYVQPTISLKVSDEFAIGGGPIYVTGSVTFDRNLNRSLTDENGNRSDVNLEAKGISAWGYTAGFMFNPCKDLRLGVNYRSEIIMEARGGDATFNDVPVFAQGTYSNTTFNADLPLPAELTAGLSFNVTKKWMIAFDFNRTMWSAYKSLTVDFDNNVPTSVNARNYHDTNTFRVGTQYVVNDKFTFRAGWYKDESPISAGYFAPETPRNDSMGYTGGLTYQINKKLGVDASFLYLHFDEIDASYDHYTENGNVIPFGGTYKSSVFSPGIGLTYSF
ncbi:long-chain fatty acid transport protein, outer membrane protein [Flavobacterium cauense R2A-7]|uniref:Long-chain fatty acid transport protein n=1 Tax=Flavobacterium cauense R2A-7 TaxID=1341154 RepID=V6S6S6_9FLAO|nr:outer membrane protein transport protein [Flavobacterium cauense]ESU20090.1 long-chain fatty acid transport protein, outer membrane protein [Flavobacterium cauense R2A-7]KGO83892.1 transporter [Flavobacterium cauense R2A-7]TWI14771.1 long-chain fatty acid transport protein [Flavobacterium cauense R2A-7]